MLRRLVIRSLGRYSIRAKMLEICLSQFRLHQRILADSLFLSVPSGEIHALTGPNGCGKTLLFDAVSRIGQTEGVTCRLDGLSLEHYRPSKNWQLGIRRLLQFPVLPRSLTVEEILNQTGASTVGHVAQLLHTTGISRSTLMCHLSFGQARIVELCATAGASSAMLLDEPFAGISPIYHPAVITFIRSCAKQGTSILCNDHFHVSNRPLYENIYQWPEEQSPPNDVSVGLPERDILGERFSAGSSKQGSVSWTVSVQVESKVIATDLQLTLEAGAIALIIGANGSGKSTLARALALVRQPSSVFTVSVRRSPLYEDVIYSPQPPKLVPELSIRDNIALMINRQFGLEHKVLMQIGYLLAWLRGGTLPLTTLAGNISGGEAALCALVGVVFSRRRIGILDEGIEGLAAGARERAVYILNQAARQGQSFVLTAQDPIPTLTHHHVLRLAVDIPLTGQH